MRVGLLTAVHGLKPRNKSELVIASSTFLDYLGSGVFAATSAIFFTRVVGIEPLKLGTALTIAAAFGMLSGFPLGHLADRMSPKRLSIGLSVIASIAMIAYATATTYEWFLLAAIIESIAANGGRSTRNVLFARVGGQEGRLRLRGYWRSIANLGTGTGAMTGALALAMNDSALYRWCILANAALTLISAQIMRKLPAVAAIEVAERPRTTEALRDHTFLAFAATYMLLNTQILILPLVVPIWIVQSTVAPRWAGAAAMVVNAVGVVLFQVGMAKRVTGMVLAGRLQRSAGFWLATGMLAYAASSIFDNPWVATALVLGAAVLEVRGEIEYSTAAYAVSYGLAPEHLHGQYQAVWNLAAGAGKMIGPAWLTWLVFGAGKGGWAVLAFQFILIGLVTPHVVRRALHDPRRREHPEALTASSP